MPGGGPQGTLLGMFLFLILINDAGFSEENRQIGTKITQAINKRKEISTGHWKYVDDLTIAEAIELKKTLKKEDEQDLVRPLSFHDRTEHTLPPERSKVQDQLNEIVEYANRNEMKVNKHKTKLMLFNSARKRDFTPKLKLEDSDIEVVDQLKLLGVHITNDLKWNANTMAITKKAYGKLWMLRRLKLNGANTNELKDIYCKHVRSVVEYAAVVWHPSLTRENTTDIERVQKCALAVILGKNYVNYENALGSLQLERLCGRREALCEKFAKKSHKSEKYSSCWFVADEKLQNTRLEPNIVKPVRSRTTRLQKSALPYLTSIINRKV